MEACSNWPSSAPWINEIEGTRLQDSCWLEKRKGYITSTMVKSICSSKNLKKTAIYLKNQKNISHLPFIIRGKQDEEKGVQYLLKHLKASGLSATPYFVGFVVHPDHKFLGASPDRLLQVNNTWSLVEIKNWYVTPKQKTLSDLPYLDRELKLKKKHAYYHQIQTAMMVTGLKTCYFVVHGTESQVQLVEFDVKLCDIIVEKCKNFHNGEFML